MHGKKAITVLRLRERATFDWLVAAFAFETAEVTTGADGGLAHAQLFWGDDVIMASTEGQIEQPTGAASIYLSVTGDEDVNAIYERVIAAGGTSVLQPEEMPYGGRNASIRDPEGNVWSVGSYQPARP